MTTDGSEDIKSFEELLENYVMFVLGKCNGNVTRAAKVSGISRITLYRHIQKYGLSNTQKSLEKFRKVKSVDYQKPPKAKVIEEVKKTSQVILEQLNKLAQMGYFVTEVVIAEDKFRDLEQEPGLEKRGAFIRIKGPVYYINVRKAS